MQVHVLSDLHLEFGAFAPDPEAVRKSDVVVLAGDIWLGARGVEWAARVFQGRPVLYVLGNHEYYGEHINRLLIACRLSTKGTNVHLLENRVAVLDGVRFLGATLWTDFELFGSSMSAVGTALWHAKDRLADFSCITFGSTGWMLPAQSVILHRASREWLEYQLALPFSGPTVVVSHHAPSIRSIAPRFSDDILSAAFASDLEPLVERADLWIHGHTHHAVDYRIGRCRVVCNPRGYADREQTGFDPGKLMEV